LGRLSPIELGGKRRSRLSGLVRLALGQLSSVPLDSEWKNEKYRRGPLVTKDASPFYPSPVSA